MIPAHCRSLKRRRHVGANANEVAETGDMVSLELTVSGLEGGTAEDLLDTLSKDR